MCYNGMDRKQTEGMTPAMALVGVILVGLLAGSASSALAEGEDWPWWRGPEKNGISREKGWNPAALSEGAKTLWKVELGKGFSNVSIKGSRLYTMGNVGNRDIVHCLNIEDGKEVWRHEYDCKLGSHPGPRATPTVEGGCVYTLSREGHLFCLDAGTGEVKWETNILREHGAENLAWGLASSPVIEGDMLLLNGGRRGLALAKATGKKIWSGGPGKGNYASLVAYDREGGKGVVSFGEEHVYGLDLASGKELWSYPWKTRYNVNAADVIIHGDKVFISSGYNHGAALLDIKAGQPSLVWENEAMRNQFSSSVLLDGYLYGIDGNTGKGSLRCLEFATGKEAWTQNLGFGSLMVADGKLIVLNEKGKLFIAEAKPDGYKEISSADTGLSPKCWTSPVLCRGRIFCRNSEGALVALDLR